MKKILLFAWLLLPIAAEAMDRNPQNNDPMKHIAKLELTFKNGEPTLFAHTGQEIGEKLELLEMFIMRGKFHNATCLVKKYPWVAGMLMADDEYPDFGIPYKALSPYYLTIAWWINPTDNEILKKVRKTSETNGSLELFTTELLKAIAKNGDDINHTLNKTFFNNEARKSWLSGALDLNGKPIKWYEMFIKTIVPQLVSDRLKKQAKPKN